MVSGESHNSGEPSGSSDEETKCSPDRNRTAAADRLYQKFRKL